MKIIFYVDYSKAYNIQENQKKVELKEVLFKRSNSWILSNTLLGTESHLLRYKSWSCSTARRSRLRTARCSFWGTSSMSSSLRYN